MSSRLSGLEVEYLIALIYSSEAGKREATVVFDIGEGTQDLGFRSEVPILFDINSAICVVLEPGAEQRSNTFSWEPFWTISRSSG